jgi:digeranylgeranylglycerophospholipid reductase
VVYDVVVVGAGPAGLVSAGFAADLGAKTLIIDRKREIGSPVRCAEVVAGNLPSDFGMKNEFDWLVAKTHYFKLLSPSGREVRIDTSPYEGYVLDRSAFEKELAKMAIARGCELALGRPATRLLKDGVAFDGKVIRSKIIIAADGVDSRIGRQAGIIKAGKIGSLGSCAQHTLVNIDVDPEVLEFDLGSKYAPGGYAWIFPKGKHEANVGVGILKPSRIRARGILERFIESRFKNPHSIRFLSGVVPSAMPPLQTVRNNVVLVGDSARQVNPFTGAGIANSFVAGRIAGKLCGEVASKGQPLSRLLEYDRLWRDIMEKKLKRSLKLRNKVMFDDRKIDRFCLLLDILPSFVLRRILNRLHY